MKITEDMVGFDIVAVIDRSHLEDDRFKLIRYETNLVDIEYSDKVVIVELGDFKE